MAGIKDIRENFDSPFVKALVAVIIVTFALFFGWGTVFSNSDGNTIASVNGKKIDVYDLDIEMARIQSILSQRLDDPNYRAEEEALKSLAINSLIRNYLVLDFLEKNEINISELTAYKMLSKNQIFQEQGQFNLQKVNTFARQNGFLPNKYIENVREDIALNFWRAGLNGSYFVTPYELERNLNLTTQTRDITFFKLSQSKASKNVELREEDLLGFYNENPFLFESDEKAKIRYLEISLDNLKNNYSISDQQLKEEYEIYVQNFDSTVRRSASHLMLNINEDRSLESALSSLRELKLRVKEGEAFEELVKEFSEDEGTKNLGGSLGISDGSAFPDKFETALETLEEGEVSEVVVLESTAHLLKLTSIQKPTPEEYLSIKETFKEELIEQMAFQEFTDVLELASDLTYSYSEIESVSKELDLKLNVTDFFTREEAGGVLKSKIIIDAIFNNLSSDIGKMSELIEIDSDTGVILEVLDFKGKETKDFEVVQEEVKTKLEDKITTENLDSLQVKILDELNKEDLPINKVIKENNLKKETYRSIGRDSSLFTKNILFEIFDVSRSEVGNSFFSATLLNGDRLIFRLDGVEEAASKMGINESDSFKDYFVQERSESNLDDLVFSMQQAGSIIIN